MRRYFSHILLVLATCGCTQALEAQERPPDSTKSAPVIVWSSPDRVIDVVTSAQPTVRKHCSFVSSDNRELVCKGHFNSRTTYLLSDVIALIEPPSNEHLGLFALPFLAGGGALIYAAVIVSSAAATVGLSVAAVFVLGAIGGMAMGDNSTSNDEIVYQKPGITLSPSLRLKHPVMNLVVLP